MCGRTVTRVIMCEWRGFRAFQKVRRQNWPCWVLYSVIRSLEKTCPIKAFGRDLPLWLPFCLLRLNRWLYCFEIVCLLNYMSSNSDKRCVCVPTTLIVIPTCLLSNSVPDWCLSESPRDSGRPRAIKIIDISNPQSVGENTNVIHLSFCCFAQFLLLADQTQQKSLVSHFYSTIYFDLKLFV